MGEELPFRGFRRANAILVRLDKLGMHPVYGDHSRLQQSGNLSSEYTLDEWEHLLTLAERGLALEEAS